MNNIEIIAVVFRSVNFTKFIYEQLKSKFNLVDGWDVGVRLILNDATQEVLDYVKTLDIEYTIYNDTNHNDFIMNRVYRCYNFSAKTSKYDNLCFVNSDMVFSENWLKNLLKHHDNNTIICPMLVESGNVSCGWQFSINKDFGRGTDVDLEGFYQYAKEISNDSLSDGGSYMPVVFNKAKFFEWGMYPEGDVLDYSGNNMGGDRWFFNKLLDEKGIKHKTVHDSIVYHIQQGEKSEK